MKKAARKGTNKKDSQPPEKFATPTREEKLAFLDFLASAYGRNLGIPPDHEEEAADKIIALYREFMEKAKIGKPRNVKEIQEFLVLCESVAKPQTQAGHDPAKEQGIANIDFTDAPLTKKREFVEALRGTSWSRVLEKAQEDEAALDEIIRVLAQLPSLYGQRPKTLDELAAFVKAADAFGKRLSPDFMSEFDPFARMPEIDGTFSEDEGRKLIQKVLEQTVAGVRQKEEALDSTLEKTFEDVNDPKTAGALLGSVMERLIKDFPGEFQSVIERTVHDRLDAKLDEIQTQLGQLYGNQEKLEKIQDQLAELTAANQERAQLGEVPPMPVVDDASPSKKEYTVDRERLTGTVDPVLFELFHEERRARGVTVSRMLDIVLWQRFDKPKLSFEIKLDEAPLSTSKETGDARATQQHGKPRKQQK